MSPKQKCHQNWNVTKTEILPKLKCHKISKCHKNSNLNQNQIPGDRHWSPWSCLLITLPFFWECGPGITQNNACFEDLSQKLVRFFRKLPRSLVKWLELLRILPLWGKNYTEKFRNLLQNIVRGNSATNTFVINSLTDAFPPDLPNISTHKP